MHACVLCHRYAEALELFDELVQGELAAASEWQWNGGSDRLHPACRDLAMRALGGISSSSSSSSCSTVDSTDPTIAQTERILSLYRDAQNEDCKISIEALCAIVRCCQHDWEMATNLFLETIDKDPASWLVLGDDCRILLDPTQQLPQSLDELVPALGMLIDTVMKVCNAHQKYGLALLCLRLFDVSISSRLALRHSNKASEEEDVPLLFSPLVQSILPTLCAVENTPEVLTTTMVALCGVKLPHEAINLFDDMEKVAPSKSPQRRPYDVYSYAESLRPAIETTVYHSWEPVQRHIHRLTACFMAISGNADENLSQADLHMLSSALAVAVRECVAASAPEAGIVLGKWVEQRPLARPLDAPTVFSLTPDNGVLPIPLTDSLLSAAVKAFAQSGKVHVAEHLVQSNLRTDRSPAEWLLSYHEAIKLLFARGQSEDGLALFRTVTTSAGNPALYCSAARSLLASGNWRTVLDLYRESLSSGCTSEELSILTMEAIAASGRIGQKDSQFPLLRSVIAETSKLLGTTPAAWTELNYWRLKRVLGFSVARLIMGWDDYRLSRLDELDLAIETLEKRANAGLTAKNAVLFSIVQAAANFNQYQIPFNATGLPRVPRDKEAWIAVLEKAVLEAKQTRLMSETNFITEVAIAYHRLGCHDACIDAVSDALVRGIKLSRAALDCAVQAADDADLHSATHDLRMMLEGPAYWK
jgi:tetratricopeptide (TPR) repeat protein